MTVGSLDPHISEGVTMNRIVLALLLAASLASSVLGAESGGVYQPLAFLAGHCWKGTFPDGKQTDEHCFSWIYGGKFLRDQHKVHGNAHPDFLGETIYFWNSAARQVEYLYIEDQGGFSRGPVATDGDTLVFPQTTFTEDGKTQTYRSRWERNGADAYDVVTEFKSDNGWVPGFKVHMQRASAK
jgi:hypothetical protein